MLRKCLMRVLYTYDFKENSFTICFYVWKNVYLSNAVLTIFLTNLGDLRMAVILTCQTKYVINFLQFRPRPHWAYFCLFCEKICHQFPETSAPGEFLIYQVLSRFSKLQRRRRPALEQNKFLSVEKSDRFVNLHALI